MTLVPRIPLTPSWYLHVIVVGTAAAQEAAWQVHVGPNFRQKTASLLLSTFPSRRWLLLDVKLRARPPIVPSHQAHACRREDGPHDEGVKQDSDYQEEAKHIHAFQLCRYVTGESCGHDEPGSRYYATRVAETMLNCYVG